MSSIISTSPLWYTETYYVFSTLTTNIIIIIIIIIIIRSYIDSLICALLAGY